MRDRPTIGLGYREPLRSWLKTALPLVECLGITAEHFFDQAEDSLARLRRLADRYPLYVHGLGLSLGTSGPLDEPTLTAFARVAKAARAPWVSDHIAFTRAAGIDLGHLNPVPRTRAMLEVLAGHLAEVAARCETPVLLENITTQFDPGGELDEPDFLNQLCAESGCRLLLDVTNLFINARNHRFPARSWLQAIQPGFIVQLHVVGYAERQGRLHDTHWPEGHRRHVLDAGAFLRHLGRTGHRSPERTEAARVQFAAGSRRLAIRFHARLGRGAGSGPGVQLLWRRGNVFERSFYLALPSRRSVSAAPGPSAALHSAAGGRTNPCEVPHPRLIDLPHSEPAVTAVTAGSIVAAGTNRD